jgi:predicted nucleic acid-binding OB-fold protein
MSSDNNGDGNINNNDDGNQTDNSSTGNREKSDLTIKGKSVTINGNDRTKDLKEHDVVCEKGRGDHERWPGNKLYRHLINVHKETYNDLPPIERSSIIGKIISSIQEKDGWFVNHNETTGAWARLSEEKVRKKVSDDLRREIRRRREKRSHNSVFSAKLRAIKQMEEAEAIDRDILETVDDPRPVDVLFGPGARRHPGNKTYWNLMKVNLDQYIISPYGARSVISRNIVQCVNSQMGRFLEQDPKTGVWYHISAKRAVEKTSHALSNMKYKTRKSLDDPVDFRLVPGSFDDMMAYDDVFGGEDDTKILDGDSPNTVFAKNRTKKFRLLSRRMDDDDDNLTLESKGSLKSAGSLEGLMMLKNHNFQTLLPATPPQPSMSTLPTGKIISPNDNSTRASAPDEARDEFQEQRNPNSNVGNYHPGQIPPGFPDGSEFTPVSGYNVQPAGGGQAADIGPRISHYENYLKGYGSVGGCSSHSGVPYKPIPYDYRTQQCHQHQYHQASGQYLQWGGNTASMTPYPTTGGGHANGSHLTGMSQQHPSPHQPQQAHDPMANNKQAGTHGGSYWPSNDWTQQHRMAGYY